MNVNLNMHMTMNARRWNGVVLGIIVALMVHLTVGFDAMRTEEPWPLLLPDNSADSDPSHHAAATAGQRLAGKAGAVRARVGTAVTNRQR